MSTKLDANQVIREIYDEPNNRIRVDAEVQASIGDLEVSINKDEDSIAVYGTDGSTQRQLKTDTAGKLLVDPKTAREKIITADDCVLTFTWADFGTDTERITSIVYSSASLSDSATKTLSYTLVGSVYRLDTITWS
jgi:hypothetical protein